MKGLEPSATGPPDRCSTKLSYIQINGRRRGIRTPIQAPKASVLPLHYVLYIEPYSKGSNSKSSVKRYKCKEIFLWQLGQRIQRLFMSLLS